MNYEQLGDRCLEWNKKVLGKVESIQKVNVCGKVKRVVGTLIEAKIPATKIGELCEISADKDNGKIVLAEVIGFSEDAVILSALTRLEDLYYDCDVKPLGSKHSIIVDENTMGMVLDGMGRDLRTGSGGIFCSGEIDDDLPITPVMSEAVAATEKPRITDVLTTGVKSLDTFITFGEGQRIGLFAGAGCGKTTLLASIARGCSADYVVFALVGERGRELKEFLDHELDPELLKRTILVCSTSDRSSMERSRAAFTATAIAETLRDQGKKVLLLIDSLTRFARAQREIGLASGEPPAKGGFPPSVYTMLPKLIERAGKTTKGSITAIYTILLEGDSMSDDPVADEAKSLLDGHIVLSRDLAEKGHYPAVNVLMSLSRVMDNIVDPSQSKLARHARMLMAKHKDLELLIRLGEYQPGEDPLSDEAVQKTPEIMEFLKQGTKEQYSLQESVTNLEQIITK
ncbi:FliI/YscN family ATPase [Agarilytica rhodophyticola]|uniref:FliI/YscN family ATPase n=1 Tax=Agarilytica rhodophyticola TaxID=1737490 RepID=UPI000B34979C|nr:FliI/YscN family ATPase [Agarilytica rhodophyticola]